MSALVCECVCEREREREVYAHMYVCVCLFVWEAESNSAEIILNPTSEDIRNEGNSPVYPATVGQAIILIDPEQKL